MRPSNVLDPQQSGYEELLSLWADLETGLARLLLTPVHVMSFESKVRGLQSWMDDLLAKDMDTGLYLLFQLASTSTAGYSPAHALVCSVLCHVAAAEMRLPAAERQALVAAAMTMNIAMTQLQNELAEQEHKPSAQQQEAVRSHAARSCMLLAKLGISNELWLDVVAAHHEVEAGPDNLAVAEPAQRLAQMLKTIDRYAAMISPRRSRQGRSVAESLREVVQGPDGRQDETGLALVRAVGLCPPGTFVRLESRETAVVLRRGVDGKNPVVAILQDSRGQPFGQPRLHRTETAGPRVQSALSHAAAGIVLNHYIMVQLGLYAAQHGRKIAA